MLPRLVHGLQRGNSFGEPVDRGLPPTDVVGQDLHEILGLLDQWRNERIEQHDEAAERQQQRHEKRQALGQLRSPVQDTGECAEVQRDQDAEEEQEKDVGNAEPEPERDDGEDGGGENGAEGEANRLGRSVIHESFRCPGRSISAAISSSSR